MLSLTKVYDPRVIRLAACFAVLLSFCPKFSAIIEIMPACVIGGVSFSGGVGTVIGVVMGVVIFTLINYGLSYIGVSPYWQYIIKGAIIVMAVAIDSLKHAKKK